MLPQQQRSGPWEPKLEARMEYVDYPCPPCKVPVPVNCLGQHEVRNLQSGHVLMQLGNTPQLPVCDYQVVQMACSEARVTSCHRPCGRALACGNHTCQLECHVVKNAADDNSVSFCWESHPVFAALTISFPGRLGRHANHARSLVCMRVPRAVRIPVCYHATRATVRPVSRWFACAVTVLWWCATSNATSGRMLMTVSGNDWRAANSAAPANCPAATTARPSATQAFAPTPSAALRRSRSSAPASGCAANSSAMRCRLGWL